MPLNNATTIQYLDWALLSALSVAYAEDHKAVIATFDLENGQIRTTFIKKAIKDDSKSRPSRQNPKSGRRKGRGSRSAAR